MEMFEHPMRAYLLFGGVEPWIDSANPDSSQSLTRAEFVVAMTPFANDQLRALAHVLLPIGTFAETSGTYVNMEGLWQSQTGAAVPVGEARPGWKVLRVLGNLLELKGFGYQSSEEVREELRSSCAGSPATSYAGTHRASRASAPAEVLDLNMYHVDALVRRAPSLQKTREGRTLPVTY